MEEEKENGSVMVELGRADVATADVFLRALSLQSRTVGQNTAEFRICRNFMVVLEARIREAMVARISK